MRNTVDYVIRPLTAADEPLLWEMLYQALHTAAGETAPPRDIVRRPELARYVEGWGRAGDTGFVAHETEENHLLGAVWLRLPIGQHKGYGYVDEKTPELAFAVTSGQRGRGIGTALLTQLVRANPNQSAISLSVAATNPAVRLYERFGFKVVEQTEGSVLMRREQ
ncbi:GNAT family N-acetyltransferase [soil metagenome]